MPANAGIHERVGMDTAFAGMTEASCQLVARIMPVHVFSKEDTKITTFGKSFFPNLRDFYVLRGEKRFSIGARLSR
jgi:hypothetical protein